VAKKRAALFQNVATSEPKEGEPATGFDKGLVAQEIIGATTRGGVPMFLIKWMSCDEPDLVPASLANVKCPQVVIGFYESNLVWGKILPTTIRNSIK